MRRGIPHWIHPSAIAIPFAGLVALILPSPLLLSSAAAEARLDIGTISVTELNSDRASWIVLDGRPADEFRDGHLPNARSFSWEEHTRTDERGVPYQPPAPDQLASVLGAMGISETTPVVVYGDADKSWGGEGWACWSLAWMGHEGPIRLLEGGIRAWRDQSLPIEKDAARPVEHVATYTHRLRPEVDVRKEELKSVSEGVAVIDTRSKVEWLLGKIPGAVHIPWDEFHHGDDRRPITPDELRSLLTAKGVDPEKPVVYYCAGGIRSAYAWMVHELSGLPEARNYEGGMEEWKRGN